MVKIAAMLEQGEGTNRNLVLAFRYYQYSAEQGHPEGQHKMGKYGFYLPVVAKCIS